MHCLNDWAATLQLFTDIDKYSDKCGIINKIWKTDEQYDKSNGIWMYLEWFLKLLKYQELLRNVYSKYITSYEEW